HQNTDFILVKCHSVTTVVHMLRFVRLIRPFCMWVMPRVELLNFTVNVIPNSANAYVCSFDNNVAGTLISVVRQTDPAAIHNRELANPANKGFMNVRVDNDRI